MLDLPLDKIDSYGMYKIYDEWPQIARKSYDAGIAEVDFKDITHIVFAGMGGSGALHDVFAAILSKTNVHVSVVKGYHLPSTVNSQTLVVTTSISGNTVETLSVLDSAKKADCKIVAFSSEGRMKNFCLENRIEHRDIPVYLSPRSSFVSFMYSMLKVLSPVIPVKKTDILESIRDMENMQQKISSRNLSLNNPSLELAKWLVGIPVIYYPWGLQAAAIRFKNALQENAKMHAIAEDVIEASHNGMVAWEKQSIVRPVLIRGQDDYTKTKERWDVIKEYFENKNIEYKEIFSVSGSILSKLMNLIYLFDYATIYRSVISGIDPTPVSAIDFIKSRLS